MKTNPSHKKKQLWLCLSGLVLAAVVGGGLWVAGSHSIQPPDAEEDSETIEQTPPQTNFPLALTAQPDEAAAPVKKTTAKASLKTGAVFESLVQQGTPAAVQQLNQILCDAHRSVDERSDAATALGEIELPQAMEALTRAVLTIKNDEIVTAALEALGQRDFNQTKSFFQTYLQSAVSSDLRVAAVEALAEAEGDPTAFLADLTADPDAEVRAAAAWALSTTDADGHSAPKLLAQLNRETDADVRQHLFEALGNQENLDASLVLPLIRKEKDPGARLVALELLAQCLHEAPAPKVQAYFDQTGVPELKNIALGSRLASDRLKALSALTHAGTPGAQQALEEIGRQRPPE